MNKGDIVKVFGFVKTIPVSANNNTEFYCSYGSKGKILSIEDEIVTLSMEHSTECYGGLGKVHVKQIETNTEGL